MRQRQQLCQLRHQARLHQTYPAESRVGRGREGGRLAEFLKQQAQRQRLQTSQKHQQLRRCWISQSQQRRLQQL